ncbi:MAG: RluA family pseudouridine synthase [Butyricicoccaceae bacterium]
MTRTEITYCIPEKDDGRTVAQVLRSRGFSRHLITQVKYRPNGLMLDGARVRTNVRVQTGQLLRADLSGQQENEHILPVSLPVRIAYEDEDILVADKPAAMPVHPSQGNYDNTLANALAYQFAQRGEPFVCRAIGRLDRDTTGLVLFAKHELSGCLLSDAMKRRAIKREYDAVCTGELPEQGTIDAPIARVDGSTIARTVDFERGERAITHFWRVRYENGYSLARVQLETGRTHQIRVHMKYIGHPLPGDFLYNPEDRIIGRQALHSRRLTFAHPITGEMMQLESPLPEDMQHIFARETI